MCRFVLVSPAHGGQGGSAYAEPRCTCSFPRFPVVCVSSGVLWLCVRARPDRAARFLFSALLFPLRQRACHQWWFRHLVGPFFLLSPCCLSEQPGVVLGRGGGRVGPASSFLPLFFLTARSSRHLAVGDFLPGHEPELALCQFLFQLRLNRIPKNN